MTRASSKGTYGNRAAGVFRVGADIGTESPPSRRQPQFGRSPDEVELGVDPELGVDAAEVALHRPFPDEEPFGDLLGGESLGGQASDVPLPPRQRSGAERGGHRPPAGA